MLSSEWKEQEELIDSFINVEEYDKLLFLLETTLFSNAPKLLCPSSFVIRILFTLCTLEEYYNADMIRNEFKQPSSDIPISQRAYQILYTLIELPKNHDSKAETDPFSPLKFDNEDVKFAKEQLIESLRFIDSSTNRYNFRPLKSKKNYKEKPIFPLMETPKKKRISVVDNESAINWSPERRKLEQEFAEVLENRGLADDNNSSDSESELDLLKTAHRKSAKILKNDRIDIALGQNKIWIAIQWCLKCSLDKNDPLIYKSWEMWNNLLSLIIEIFKMEFDDFVDRHEEDEQLIFEDLIVFKFLEHAAQSLWDTKLPELLLKTETFTSLPIFKHELTKSKSIIIERVLQEPENAKQISTKGSKLLRDIFLLSCKATRYRKYDISVSHRSMWSFDNLVTNFTLLLRTGTYQDLVHFVQIDDEYMDDELIVEIYEHILTCFLVQLTTYKFKQNDDFYWIFENDARSFGFIIDLFEKVAFTESLFYTDGIYDTEKALDDYNKVTVILYNFFKLWVHCAEVNLDQQLMQKVLDSAKIGEVGRLRIIKKIYKNAHKQLPNDELRNLATFIKFELENIN